MRLIVFIRAVEQVVNGLVIMKRETSGFKLSARASQNLEDSLEGKRDKYTQNL